MSRRVLVRGRASVGWGGSRGRRGGRCGLGGVGGEAFEAPLRAQSGERLADVADGLGDDRGVGAGLAGRSCVAGQPGQVPAERGAGGGGHGLGLRHGLKMCDGMRPADPFAGWFAGPFTGWCAVLRALPAFALLPVLLVLRAWLVLCARCVLRARSVFAVLLVLAPLLVVVGRVGVEQMAFRFGQWGAAQQGDEQVGAQGVDATLVAVGFHGARDGGEPVEDGLHVGVGKVTADEVGCAGRVVPVFDPAAFDRVVLAFMRGVGIECGQEPADSTPELGGGEPRQLGTGRQIVPAGGAGRIKADGRGDRHRTHLPPTTKAYRTYYRMNGEIGR